MKKKNVGIKLKKKDQHNKRVKLVTSLALIALTASLPATVGGANVITGGALVAVGGATVGATVVSGRGWIVGTAGSKTSRGYSGG